MLISMTGHGQAQETAGGTTVWVEIRSVNNRFLKLSINGSEGLEEMEPRIRQVVQKSMRRGAVTISIELTGENGFDGPRFNMDLLQRLHRQLLSIDPATPLSAVLAAPGVVEAAIRSTSHELSPDLWELVESALQKALDHLGAMRRVEGNAMAEDLLANCHAIEEELKTIIVRAPEIVAAYARRLTERINQLLAEHELSIGPTDIVREVGVFADRCDISEETSRLMAHLGQFRSQVADPAADGRKLEFLAQEMLREANTIGSKSNDTSISRSVVEIKTAIERIREMVQNVE